MENKSIDRIKYVGKKAILQQMASIYRNESVHYLHLPIPRGTNVNHYCIMPHKDEQMSSFS